MLKTLVSEPSPGIRALALIWFMETRADPDRALPILLRALEDPSPEVRRGAAAALGAYGPPKSAVEPLRKIARTDEDYVAWVARKALRSLDPEAAAKVAPREWVLSLMSAEDLPVTFIVAFSEHIPPDRITEMSGTLAGLGDLEKLEGRGRFAVIVTRASRLESLKIMLKIWESHGFVRYNRI
jgi:hypothetical protein